MQHEPLISINRSHLGPPPLLLWEPADWLTWRQLKVLLCSDTERSCCFLPPQHGCNSRRNSQRSRDYQVSLPTRKKSNLSKLETSCTNMNGRMLHAAAVSDSPSPAVSSLNQLEVSSKVRGFTGDFALLLVKVSSAESGSLLDGFSFFRARYPVGVSGSPPVDPHLLRPAATV